MSIRGVYWSRGNQRWRAVLSGYGHRGYIGEYRTEAEATAARRAAEVALHGRHHDSSDFVADGDVTRIPLLSLDGRTKAWAVIDTADVSLAAGKGWCLSVTGYAVARVGGKVVFLHRLIMPGDGLGDHISGDKLDCRRANLRLCTAKENARNAAPKKPRSGFKGVIAETSGRFSARIMVDRKVINLGLHEEPEDAARAYDAAAHQYFGAFARPNFPKTPAERPGVDIHITPYIPGEPG